MTEEVTIITTEIQKIIRTTNKLYANKLDNLHKTIKFLGTYTLPKLNQKEKLNITVITKLKQ